MDDAGGADDAVVTPVPELPVRLASRFRLGAVRERTAGTVVLDARDTLLDRPATVTLHLVDRDAVGADAALEALAALDHPHLVPVFDAEAASDGTVAVATSWCSGGDLADALDTGSMDTAATLAAVAGVADALDHVHRRGLVHGAVGMRAVRLDDDGRALLADAGTAALHGRTGADAADDVRDAAELLVTVLGAGAVPADVAPLLRAATAPDPAARPTAAELTTGLRRAAVATARGPAAVATSGHGLPARGRPVTGAPAGALARRRRPASRGAVLAAGVAASILVAGTVAAAAGWPVQSASDDATVAAAPSLGAPDAGATPGTAYPSAAPSRDAADPGTATPGSVDRAARDAGAGPAASDRTPADPVRTADTAAPATSQGSPASSGSDDGDEPAASGPAASQPTTSDAVGSGSATAEPTTSEPAPVDPGSTDPGSTDPGSTDPGSTVPSTEEPAATTTSAPDEGATPESGSGVVRAVRGLLGLDARA